MWISDLYCDIASVNTTYQRYNLSRAENIFVHFGTTSDMELIVSADSDILTIL